MFNSISFVSVLLNSLGITSNFVFIFISVFFVSFLYFRHSSTNVDISLKSDIFILSIKLNFSKSLGSGVKTKCLL